MRFAAIFSTLLAVLAAPMAAQAHFQEIIPSADILPDSGDRTLTLDLTFTHPMEGGPVMNMGVPQRFGVLSNGKIQDLTGQLRAVKRGGDKTGYQASYKVNAPGDYVFFVAPAPYWEPAERKHIIHYAKVVVDFASGSGWDKPVGLPVEIEPLTRPYGLWTGNLFRGVVRHDGKPVPYAEIEVEWRNDGSVTAPSDPYVTQVVKADGDGVFAYAIPRAGWWGFAALAQGKPMPGPDGKPAAMELGGLLWVKTRDMK